MIQGHHLSQRHANLLLRLGCYSYRNPPQPDQFTRDLCECIVVIAHLQRRFGYRRIHDVRNQEFPRVNHKWVYPLYQYANLALRRRKKTKRPLSERVPRQLAQTVNGVWGTDFVSDSLSNGRRIKCLMVADDFRH
jgi:putative transposase